MVAGERQAAMGAGLKYYFTGKPCKRGHIDKRFVSSFCCMTCAREKAFERLRRLGVKQWTPAQPDYQKRYYARNKEQRKSEALAWYQANAERAIALQKVSAAKRRREAPALVRALGRKSAAKRRAIQARVFVEVVDPMTVFTRDKGICGICQATVDVTSAWEVDHIVPISKGGAHAYANVQLAHRACNRSKGAKVA